MSDLASHCFDLRSPQAGVSTPAPPQLDWHELLVPLPGAAPSGPDLEYSAEFAELELLANGTPDHHMGTSLVPGQAPDPLAVLQRGAALLQRTKDVRVLVHVLAASLSVLGIHSFIGGLGALHQLLERFWDTAHPGLDPEDEALATARANATMACASPRLVLALRRAPLFEVSSGRLSLEDTLSLLRERSAADGPASSSPRPSSLLSERTPGELAVLLSSLQAGLSHTTAILSLFAARSAALPDLQALQAFFRDALGVLRQHGPAEASTPPLASTAQQRASRAQAVAPGAVESSALGQEPRNSITSRDDVRNALDAICAYYHYHEPASPLPLLLRRCQRLVGLDFLATLRELAPEAVDKVVLLGGTSGDAAGPA